ncbi:MAG: ABC transporter substrate-binding protein [Cellvibrionaceae bacterium]
MINTLARFLLVVVCGGLLVVPVYGEENVFHIYHDADYSSHKESAQSMKMGFLTALDEMNNQVNGYRLKLIEKDHRGNTVRSKLHMQQFLKDPKALFMLGGLHSPPYIKHRDFINQNGILLAVPWAAGGPITRYNKGKNWIYRLSIDDTKAGYRIAQFALDNKDCKNPHLLLEDTPWGKSNFKTMTSAISEKLGGAPQYTFFQWNTKLNTAQIILRNIISQDVDCLLFVGNAIEGESFVRAMLAQEKQIPIVSHWGITGGNFHKTINYEVRKDLDLNFIQTCFSFISSKPTELSKAVSSRAVTLFSDLNKASDIPAPAGFIHAYDLTKIMLSALQEISVANTIEKNRSVLREKLEGLSSPVNGLLKVYSKPFSQVSINNPDGHEALDLSDFCMGRYNADDNVILN